MTDDIRLIGKIEVCELLGISDRTLEKLVKSRRFPGPLRLGKKVSWVEAVVKSWLLLAVSSQLNWEPPKRIKRTPSAADVKKQALEATSS